MDGYPEKRQLQRAQVRKGWKNYCNLDQAVAMPPGLNNGIASFFEPEPMKKIQS